ncbi:MAG: PD-(D/E)XK nuclease family protein [Phycisphaerales bacterium]
MAVQFVLGRSGTGKTSYCVRAIADALLEPSDQPLLFLVPEQATYQAERAILSDPRIRGYNRLHILSFDRLQFLLLGKSTARPAISRIGRQMIVHKILRDNLDKLQIFGPSALLPGFAREMASTITELYQYAKSAEDIEGLQKYLQAGGIRPQAAGEALQPTASGLQPSNHRLSSLKFADIGLVFRRYAEALRDKFVDPDAQIVAACRAVGKSPIIKGARLWVDGFASFTGGEMALLLEVFKAVDQAHMALCVDAGDVGIGVPDDGAATRAGLFEPTARTYRDMLERFAEAKIEVVKPLILNHVGRFAKCPALAHVEQNVFRLGAGKAKAGGDIRLVAAPSLRLEIQFVGRQILSLVRDKGYRYCDIAVVASDLGQYEQYVRAYFEDYGVPFFIDKRKPLSQHPVIELVCAALQAVIGGFAHGDLFAYLKTDLVPVDNAAVDLLENYCLAFGVDGRDWASGEPWRFKDPDDEQFDEDQINRIRVEAVRPLLELRQVLCPDGDLEKKLNASEFTRVIFAFLDRLQVRRTVGQWVNEAQQKGDPVGADEHRQFFDAFVDIFDTLVEIFNGQEMAVPDYFGLIASAFSQMTLAFIPPKLDQVLVGSIERSRHPNLKAIFLLGATQKQFPIPLASSGLLSDEDREAAEAADFELAPSSTQSLIDRQYLAYIAFTRPSRFMCISYPCVDEKGSPIMRSHFIDELQSLFEDVAEESLSDNLLTLSEVQSGPELGELLSCRLGRDFVGSDAIRRCRVEPDAQRPFGSGPSANRGQDACDAKTCPDGHTTNEEGLAGLLRAMLADSEFGEMSRLIVSALGYENRASLDPAVVKEMYGRTLRGSATRLGMFAACPYKHFVRYVLDLKPRREFKLEPLDLGLFYHHILDALQKRLRAEKLDIAAVEQDRLLQLLHDETARLMESDPFISQFIHRSAHNAFVIASAGRILEECVLGIAQMVRAGSFRPILSEAPFGRPPEEEGQLGRFDLPLADGRVLSLDGKIDRLDVAEIDGKKVALVLDYKRTGWGASFNWGDFYHGLDVQLAIYMLAVQYAGAGVVDDIAGALYMPIETPPETATLAELAEEEPRKFPYKPRGILNGAYWSHVDPNASGYSRYYNFYVKKKDNDPYGMYGTSNLLKPGHFQHLLEWSKASLQRLAADILSGRIDAKPYHRGADRACTYCEYTGVCHFDWQVNEYQFLRSVGKSDLMAEFDKA